MRQFPKVPSLQNLPSETLRRICDVLMDMKTPGDQFIGLRTVLSLTRTSQALHEHAVDALWHTIPGFGILVYSLPRKFWRSSRVGGPAGPIELALIPNRPLKDADLLRFNHYAPRVKRILLPSDCLHLPPSTRALSFSPNILDAFECRPYGWVLPNLRVYCCSPDLRHYADFYQSFSIVYGPKLQEVNTQCPYVDDNAPKVVESHWKETLARLHALAPKLSSLNLNANEQPFGLTISPLLSSVVAATSQNLRVLQLGQLPINLGAVRYLATLPFLSELAAKLDDDITANDLVLLFKPGNTCFPALGELHLSHSYDLFLLVLFMHFTRPANARLRIISLYILEDMVPFDLVINLLDEILEHEHVRNFTAISLNCFVDPESPGPHVLTEAHLRPFLQLKELTRFELGIRCDFDFDNCTLKKVVAAWPNLTALVLGPSPTAKTSKIHLNDLVPLVRGCPQLKTLGLTIDAAVYTEGPIDLNGIYGSWLLHGPSVNVDLSMMPKDARYVPASLKVKPGVLDMLQSPLEELRLGCSRIDDPAGVAAALSCFFPELKRIQGSWRHAEMLGHDHAVFSEEERLEIIEESEWGHAWQDVVGRILPAMVQARKHERNARRLAERRELIVA